MKLSEAHFRRQRRSFWQKIIATGGVAVIVIATLFVFIFWVKAVVVEVIPEAAATNAKRVLYGWGWVQQDKVYLLSSEANLKVSASGFISETVSLEHSTLERRIVVELKEAPALIKATATPADPNIQWQIDSKYVASGPTLQAPVEPGTHTVQVVHPYYQPQEVSVNLMRGDEQTLEFVLEPVQGSLNISSKPEGVPILLNDISAGQTPITLSRPGGSYRLRIETSNFESIEDTIEITYAQPVTNRNYRLIYKKALLTLTLKPPSGRLLINGKISPTNTMPLELEPMRETIISYIKPGYLSKTIKRTFKPAQQENISISLQAEFGEVIINANPQADIKIDDEAIGKTPQTLTLSAVPHTVHLSRPGYRSIQKVVRPNSRSPIQINETLLSEQQATLAESPTVAKNSIGLELILFKPNKNIVYELGAHRSERGQRANEILRSVSLDRPFYISRNEISAKHYHAFNQQIPVSELAVNNISWGEAALFCNALSARENLAPFYIINNNTVRGYNPDSTGYRLPSEAEWEWLARYANRSASTLFIWGNQTTLPKNVGNLADESAKNNVAFYIPNYNDGYPQLAPVGSFKRDRAGLHDLVGNLSEWVHDVYSVEIPSEPLRDPLGMANNTSQSGHVVKGSSWRSGTLAELRSAYRQRAIGKSDSIGFRVARYIY